MQCYLLLPVALKYFKFGLIATALSLFIFFLSNISILDKYSFGYFLPLGTFFIFMVGASISRKNMSSTYKHFPTIISLSSIIGIFTIEVGIIQRGGFQSEVLLGIFSGILLICFLQRFSSKPGNRFLGSISYGIFLYHFLFIYIFQHESLIETNQLLKYSSIVVSTIFISILSHIFFERKIHAWRLSISN